MHLLLESAQLLLEQNLRALQRARQAAKALEEGEIINLHAEWTAQLEFLEELYLISTKLYAIGLWESEDQPMFGWDELEFSPLRLYFGPEDDVHEFESLEDVHAFVTRHLALFKYARKRALAYCGAPDPGPAPETKSTDWVPTVLAQDGVLTGYSIGNVAVTYELDLPNLDLYLAYLMALTWSLENFARYAEDLYADDEEEDLAEAPAEVAA